MALAEMRKARIAVHKSVADELAKKIQSLRCCEFISQGDSAFHGASFRSFHAERLHLDELAGDAKYLLRFLEPYETKKDGSIAKMLGDIPAITFDRLAAQFSEKKFVDFVDTVRGKEKKLTDAHAEASRLNGLLSQITLIENISYPLELLTTGTDLLIGAAFSVLKTCSTEFERRIAEELGDMAEIQHIAGKDKDAADISVFVFRKTDSEKVASVATEFGAAKIDIPKELKLTAANEKEKTEYALSLSESKAKEAESELVSLADSGLDFVRTTSDYLSVMHDKYEAVESGEHTDEVLIWNLWIPKADACNLEMLINDFSNFAELIFIKPDKGEEPPTLLKNPSWSSCMEPLTVMYGTPTYGKTDPTSLMAPFFFLFLGMCFGDAGYGLLLTAVLGYFLVKHRMVPTMRKFFVLMTVGMIVTVLFGAITGSWFGDSVTAFPFLSPLVPFAKNIQLLDPMNDPMTLLGISLGLGFIQVIFGLFIAFAENWRNGDKFAACADQGGWIIFLIGLVLIGLSMSGKLCASFILPSKIIAVLGALILVTTQGREKTNIFGKIFSGVMSLYNVTGYLGDVLSYSRLLALGLGSAAVGMVINLLAKLVADTQYVGIPLAILIFILGHLFSVAVNLLGAFIHSLRLQYVEFFGKFYNATGHDFSPLGLKTQYSRISEDA